MADRITANHMKRAAIVYVRQYDRLILGVKGSVSEYELSLFRQRSQEAIQAKARRGELTFTLPAGLSWTADGQIELNPDRRGGETSTESSTPRAQRLPGSPTWPSSASAFALRPSGAEPLQEGGAELLTLRTANVIERCTRKSGNACSVDDSGR